MKWAKQTGFTIVELLIVIVVIAILAAITIVAYTGIQERARYTTMQSDLVAVNKAIQMYYTDEGRYPYVTATGGNTGSTITTIPGLVPKYISKIPTFPEGSTGYYVYIWSDNGANYKLVRLVSNSSQLPSIEQSATNPDTNRTGRGWGYWSPGGANL